MLCVLILCVYYRFLFILIDLVMLIGFVYYY